MRSILLNLVALLTVILVAAGCAPSGSDKAIRLTSGNFENEVLKSDVPVLVDFWATWCGPCRTMDPVIQELAVEFAGRVKVGKLDVDQNKDLAQKYDISSIPRFILFKGGRPVASIHNVVAKRKLVDMLNAAL